MSIADQILLKKLQILLEKSPGQKARTIASQLNEDRSEVSRVLHAHKDIFVQDQEEYTWSLAALNIDLGSNCWLTTEDFEDALLQVGSPLDASEERITFVVGERCQIMLEALARLLAICNQLVDADKSVTIDFCASGATLTYLNRIGFIDLLRTDVKILPKRPKVSAAAIYEGNNEGVVELRSIDPVQPDDGIADLLRDSFVSCAGTQYHVAAHTVIGELFDNVKEHSGTKVAAFAGLQNYAGPKTRRKHIQTVISDGGHGIVGTIMPILDHYPGLAKKISGSRLDPRIALLEAVFSKGGISQTKDSGRGLGLKRSSEYAQKYNALISVRQETFELKIEHVGERMSFTHRLDLARIAGTHICFDFHLD